MFVSDISNGDISFSGWNYNETFGDINTDGTGEDWEYLDSWAYKDKIGHRLIETTSINCSYPIFQF